MGNCGVHVYMWASAIISSSIATFNGKDIMTARKGRFLADFPVIKKTSKAMQINNALITSFDCILEMRNVFKTMTTSRSSPLSFNSTSDFVISIKALIDIESD